MVKEAKKKKLFKKFDNEEMRKSNSFEGKSKGINREWTCVIGKRILIHQGSNGTRKIWDLHNSGLVEQKKTNIRVCAVRVHLYNIKKQTK